MQREKIYIYGKHALEEALANTPEVIRKVFVAPGALPKEAVRRLQEMNVGIGELKDQKNVGSDASHQGVVAVVDPGKLMRGLEDFLSGLAVSADTALILLDELQDPQNVGAVIRSAAAFGAAGVLIPENNQAQVSGAVVKTSAGMTFRIPLVSIGNVNMTIRTLKDKGFWIYGLAMDGANELSNERFDSPAVFVVGNEGEGIRRKTLEYCDVKLKIPMHPRTESLNAAVSAAIVLYEWSSQHNDAIA